MTSTTKTPFRLYHPRGFMPAALEEWEELSSQRVFLRVRKIYPGFSMPSKEMPSPDLLFIFFARLLLAPTDVAVLVRWNFINNWIWSFSSMPRGQSFPCEAELLVSQMYSTLWMQLFQELWVRSNSDHGWALSEELQIMSASLVAPRLMAFMAIDMDSVRSNPS